ncbi:MAG: YopX family protein [Eubacterium sp.]|nr:YopX family protein [Eubacterium sp.]
MDESRGLWRGKRVDNGEWAEGYLSKVRNINEKPALLKWCIDYEEKGVMMSCIVDPSTLGECTSLTDKNGKRIFEGDICKDSLGKIFIVEWDTNNARFLGWTRSGEQHIVYVGKEPKAEVVGNIHDNPELLKGADNE